MRLNYLKRNLLGIAFLSILHLTTKSTAFSQTTSQSNCDSLKCFTYSEARKILTDLRQLPIKDSIIQRQDSIISISDTIIKKHEVKIEYQRIELFEKTTQLEKSKKRSKLFIIFAGLLGLSSQLIF